LADALTVPHAVAAIVLCVAGLAKLRAPGAAATAVGAPVALVRVFAAYEVALGIAALVWPPVSPLLALTYLGLAVLTFSLARRAGSCGCFGEGDAPASVAQSLLSVALALVSVAPAHAVTWVAGRPAPSAIVLVLGIGAAAYGTVVAYAEVPPAWRAWSAS
jgi:hypothetical protein